MTNIQSFINLRDWLHNIREFSDKNVVIALVANKSDLVEDDDKMKGYGRFAGRDSASLESKNYSNLVQDTEEDNENSHDIR